jgi:hypothetical protein
MSEHIQTSAGVTTARTVPGTSVEAARVGDRPFSRVWRRILIGLVLFALALFILLPIGASQKTFFYIRPGMPRWLVEYIVGRPGYFNPPRFGQVDLWKTDFRPPATGASEVSRWLTDSLAAVVSYDANGRVIDVQYRKRESWERWPEPRSMPASNGAD